MAGATGIVTLTFSNPKAGAVYYLKVIQDSGGHGITWPGTVVWPNGTAPTMSTGDDDVDLVKFIYDGSNYLGTLEGANFF
jgi:hypothetical protein